MGSRRQSIAALLAGLTGTVVLTALATSSGGAAAVASPGGCEATARIETQWGSGAAGGEILAVTVTNVSLVTTTKWTATWALASGQRVVSGWNATVTTSGGTATAVNASYNGALAPGASATFGMQLSGTSPAPALSCDNGASPPPSSPPPGGPDVTVDESSSQSAITLVVGQTLGVSLGAEYLPPTAAGAALTKLSVSGGYPTGQALSALYSAASPGTTDVTTRSDYACLHATPPCTVPIRLWTVHVTVVTATGRTVTVSRTDNQSAVRLRVGDTLVVSLAENYLPPKLSVAGILVQRDTVGGYPTGRPLLARYVAAAPGTVGVSTVTDTACNHDPTPCPSPQIPWSITVTITT
jgi:cellulose binding protein with CBM2 domain